MLWVLLVFMVRHVATEFCQAQAVSRSRALRATSVCLLLGLELDLLVRYQADHIGGNRQKGLCCVSGKLQTVATVTGQWL